MTDALMDAVMTGMDPYRAEKMPLKDGLPDRRPRRHLVISVDDHLVEPAHMFEGRLPARFAARTPHVVERDDGRQVWLMDDVVLDQIAINAVAGQSRDSIMVEPTRFEMMRPAAWDIHARIRDMDVDGVYASLCFPSLVGFAGVRLQGLPDREFALALLRAWNDWHLEEWVGSYPGRMIACQVPWLNDIEVGAEEIRRNAARGFRAVTFPELPGKIGFEPLVSAHWDPFWRACEETGTVVCVHTGSSGLPVITEGAPQAMGTLFGSGYAMITAIEWLHSGIAARFPGIKICLSESGIGWVAGVFDRLRHQEGYRDAKPHYALDGDPDRTGLQLGDPMLAEVFRRNFWFCTLDDVAGVEQRHRIGLDRILFEVDYPHADTSWPDTQDRVGELLAGVPADDAARITWKNAAELFRLDVPLEVQLDPERF